MMVNGGELNKHNVRLVANVSDHGEQHKSLVIWVGDHSMTLDINEGSFDVSRIERFLDMLHDALVVIGERDAEETNPQSGAVLCPACGKCDWKYTYRSPVDPAHDKFKCVCGREWQRYS
jgi:hypothetical protein